MDTAIHPGTDRGNPGEALRAVSKLQSLTAQAHYELTEAGRKAFGRCLAPPMTLAQGIRYSSS